MFNSSVPPGPFNREILTPSKLAARIQAGFDREFGQIWLEGEISELSLPQSGHAYFSLKERTGGQETRLKAVMWKGRRPYAGAALTEGLAVLVRGRLAVYAPRGDFQIVVDYLEPRGEGALRLAFEKLKAKLEAEGFFEESRKRPLPYWPAKVVVISSPSGAAVRDFIKTATRRRPGAAISLYPARVQGVGAAGEIVRALEDINAWGEADLIVLTRGGGSLSDLWAFNEEAVVRAVAASRTVTLAAIGHSTDLTLTEMAADHKAITPTAAAEAVFRDQSILRYHVGEMETRLRQALKSLAETRRERINLLTRRLAQSLTHQNQRWRDGLDRLLWRLGRFEDRLGFYGQRLDDFDRGLGRGLTALIESRSRQITALARALEILSPSRLMADRSKELTAVNGRLSRSLARRLEHSQRRLETLTARLKSLSPEGILKRGYALVTVKPQGAVLTRAGDTKPFDEITVRLSEGRLTAMVKDIYEEKRTDL